MPDDFALRDDGYVPERALVIMAHPDDIEFSCAGTMARWVDGGCAVCYVLVTSGDGGIDEPGMTRARAAEIRAAEQRAAAAALGVDEVVFLGEPDGMVENTMALRRRLVREIRRFRPEVVVTFDPAALWVAEDYINHPDHRAVGMAAVDAAFPAAGQPNVFEELAEEGLAAHKVRKLYAVAFGPEGVNAVVDIGAVLDRKLAALRCHASQFVGWDPETFVRQWSLDAAKGTPHEHVERFRVVRLITDEEFERRRGTAKGAALTGHPPPPRL